MSDSPAGAPNGAPAGPPKPKTTNPLRPMRKRPVNPLVAKARKSAPRPSAAASGSSNGSKPAQNGEKLSLEEARRKYGGWSEPAPKEYRDIPVVTTKRAIMDGIRYHLMRFNQSKADDEPIDPTNGEEFARPVTLHRRDARQPPPGRMVKEEPDEAPERPAPDVVELERQAQLKAEKEAQKAIDQAKIAPVMKDAATKKQPKKQKEEKTTFNRAPRTQEAKKESDLRYEEALPWHLEDADGKNVWVGNYVSALSETNAIMMIDGGKFRMIPLEKWYRFTSKPPFRPFTIDQAEAFLNKKMDPGMWAKRTEAKMAGERQLDDMRKAMYGRGRMVKTESATFKAASRSEKLEHDELDVEDDEFQDDDENPYFEKQAEDEEVKDSKDRVRREQLGANLFGDADEQEIDKDLEAQLKEEMERKELGKRTRKALIKRDREEIYESDDSGDNPWSSSSESSSEEEEEEESEEKKDGESRDVNSDTNSAAAKEKNKPGGSKGSTPQGKHKQPDLKKKSLKRAGSPALSESSGNESTRKKIKKTITPGTGSRSGTPLPPGAAARRARTGAGSGSDGEMTAGEMSDRGAAKRKIKLVSSSKGTPSGSRAGSPAPAQGATSPRAGSPAVSSPKTVTAAEIQEKIPPEGIEIGALIKLFSGRVGGGPGQMPKPDWIKLVRETCDFGADKKLKRKS